LTASPLLNAPVATTEYDAEEARPLQDLPRTQLWARLEIGTRFS